MFYDFLFNGFLFLSFFFRYAINEFLKKQKERLLKDYKNHDTKNIVYVIGNKVDLDTVATAVTAAIFYENLSVDERKIFFNGIEGMELWTFVPLANMDRKQYYYKSETQYSMDKNNVDLWNVLTP